MLFRQIERSFDGNRLILGRNLAPDEANGIYPGEEYSYEFLMLTENSVNGIMPFELEFREGRECFVFELGEMRSLEEFYKGRELDYFELSVLLKAIDEIFRSLGEFMLDPQGLLFSPENIFLSGNMEVGFIYLPGESADLSKAMSELAEFMIKKTDHLDKKAVYASYEYYKRVVTGVFSPEGLYERDMRDFYPGRGNDLKQTVHEEIRDNNPEYYGEGDIYGDDGEYEGVYDARLNPGSQKIQAGMGYAERRSTGRRRADEKIPDRGYPGRRNTERRADEKVPQREYAEKRNTDEKIPEREYAEKRNRDEKIPDRGYPGRRNAEGRNTDKYYPDKEYPGRRGGERRRKSEKTSDVSYRESLEETTLRRGNIRRRRKKSEETKEETERELNFGIVILCIILILIISSAVLSVLILRPPGLIDIFYEKWVISVIAAFLSILMFIPVLEINKAYKRQRKRGEQR